MSNVLEGTEEEPVARKQNYPTWVHLHGLRSHSASLLPLLSVLPIPSSVMLPGTLSLLSVRWVGGKIETNLQAPRLTPCNDQSSLRFLGSLALLPM